MTREQKTKEIKKLKRKFRRNEYFYLTDSSELTVAEVNDLRRLCFKKGVEFKVVKNTLARKAMEAIAKEKNLEGIYDSLKGPTAIMFSEVANIPAKVIEEFRKDHEKPVMKAAYIDTDIFVGDDKLDELSKLKSKEELLAEIISLLESPMMSVLGQLDSAANTITGILTTLEKGDSES